MSLCMLDSGDIEILGTHGYVSKKEEMEADAFIDECFPEENDSNNSLHGSKRKQLRHKRISKFNKLEKSFRNMI